MSSLDCSSCLEKSTPQKLKKRKFPGEFIVKLIDGKNNYLEGYLPSRALGTFP